MDTVRKELEEHFDPVITAQILDLARVCKQRSQFLTITITKPNEEIVEVQLYPTNDHGPARRKDDLNNGNWGVKIKKW